MCEDKQHLIIHHCQHTLHALHTAHPWLQSSSWCSYVVKFADDTGATSQSAGRRWMNCAFNLFINISEPKEMVVACGSAPPPSHLYIDGSAVEMVSWIKYIPCPKELDCTTPSHIRTNCLALLSICYYCCYPPIVVHMCIYIFSILFVSICILTWVCCLYCNKKLLRLSASSAFRQLKVRKYILSTVKARVTWNSVFSPGCLQI